ncbi:unnamed protein product [Trichobilharzia regenti]|nr:unnamed protein product [Trichobilharzia regenti]
MTIQCAWCKIGYHNKSSCFHESLLSSEPCSLGPHSDLIVPPDWIIKLSEGFCYKVAVLFEAEKLSGNVFWTAALNDPDSDPYKEEMSSFKTFTSVKNLET